MKIYDICFKILKSVLKDKISFSSSLKKNSAGVKKEDAVLASNLSGLFLRNYFLICVIADAIFNVKDEEPLIYIGVVYMNNSYKKALDEKESIKYLIQKLNLYQVKFDDEAKAKWEAAVADKREFLRQNVGGNRFKFLSARNNLPIWVVKSLINQYDDDIAIKTINAMTKMPSQFAYLNKALAVEDYESKLGDFQKVQGNLYLYKSNNSIRKNELVRNGTLVPVQKAEYYFGLKLPDVQNGFVAMYFDGKNSVYPIVFDKYLANNKVSILSPNARGNSDLFLRVKNKAGDNLKVYESTQGEIIAHLSEKQDVFIYSPESSELELLRRAPEYGILFDTSKLDGIIANQTKGLQDVVQYVAEGGYLIYIVPTFNIKETYVRTRDFLQNNKDFTFTGEKLFFPFEQENSVYYYAILKRK
ncbi:MAG: hypothetical protein J6X03_02510 [Bacilli bacterium]|nr:hypothetical protein [Bacilli bacterium]